MIPIQTRFFSNSNNIVLPYSNTLKAMTKIFFSTKFHRPKPLVFMVLVILTEATFMEYVRYNGGRY